MTETYDQYGGQPSALDPPARAQGCGRPFCNHPDNHVCPWLNETTADNKVIRCGCTHKPPPKETA